MSFEIDYFRTMLYKCFLILILSFPLSLLAQESNSKSTVFNDSTKTEAEVEKKGRSEVIINAITSYQMPSGPLAQKFNPFYGLGAGFLYKTRSNWYIGVDGVWLFNDRTKNPEDVIDLIIASNGTLIGQDGQRGNPFISQRGLSLQFLKIGKLLVKAPVLSGNENSGIVGMLGFGLFQNQYRIIDRDNTLPQISKDYAKGYDELRNGFSVNPFLGYVYFDQNKFINFIFGIEYTGAWTKSRRDYNFGLMMKDETNYYDESFNIKLMWNIPIRKKLSRDYYYF